MTPPLAYPVCVRPLISANSVVPAPLALVAQVCAGVAPASARLVSCVVSGGESTTHLAKLVHVTRQKHVRVKPNHPLEWSPQNVELVKNTGALPPTRPARKPRCVRETAPPHDRRVHGEFRHRVQLGLSLLCFIG
eukprot:scaffold45149_cov63-Phaeocystis_antarctica.AAC.9